jgi:hypothetical protein
VGLAAPVAFQDLRLLVLGEHALELHQQLVLGRLATRALDELHPRAGPGELLDQQGLVGELAGQLVRGVAQHHGHAPDDVASHRIRARWYTTKTEPSYDDMTIKLRRVIIAARFRGPCPEQATPQETRAVLAACAPAGT